MTDNINRTARALVCLLLAVLTLAAPGSAGDEDVYAALMRRFDSVNDEVQKALADLEYETTDLEHPERSLSMRRNAIVTVGGELRTTYVHNKSTFHDPGFEPGARFKKYDERLGEFHIPSAKFLVDARINKRWRVFMDLNASHSRGLHSYRKFRNPNTPDTANPTSEYSLEQESDLINQAYIELMKADHSGFGMLAGKLKLPFGLWDRPNLIAQSFLDAPNLAGSYLAGDSFRSDRALLPHASRMIDPVVALMVNYQMRDIVRFEAAVFQERDTNKISEYRPDDGVHRVRHESSMPQSWQIGASLMPLDGWELTMHFRNRHNRGRGLADFVDSPFRWDFRNALVSGFHNPRWDPDRGQWSDTGTGPGFGSTRNEQSFIIGLAVDVPNTNLQVRTEYARGWNQNFNRRIKSEDVNIGLSYKLLPKLTIHGQGEWMQVKDGSWMAPDGAGGWTRDRRNNHLYRAMVGLEYELMRNMNIEAGWQYEYWRMKSARGSDGLGPEQYTNKANIFYIGTRFVF